MATLTKEGTIIGTKNDVITKKYKFPNKQLSKFKNMGIHGQMYYTYYLYNRPKGHYILPKTALQFMDEWDYNEDYLPKTKTIDIKAENLLLRPEQQKLLDDLGDKNFALFKARTGFGKSYVIAGLIDKLKTSTLIIVPKVEIAKGLYDKLGEVFPDNVVVYKGKEGVTKPITIIVSASFRKYWKDLDGQFDTLVFDEAHMDMFGKERIKALCYMHYTRLYGLTATPERDEIDTKYFEHIYGPIIEAEAKKVVEPVIVPKEFNTEIDEAWDHWSELLDNLVNSDERIMDMAFTIIEVMSIKTRNMGIVFVDRVEMAEKINTILEAVGFPSATYTSKTQNREEILEEMNRKRGVIIATYQTVGVGFDYPSLDTGFFYMNIKFKGTVKQAVGRILRKNTDDHKPVLVDWQDNIRSLKGQVRERMKAYREAFPNTSILPYNVIESGRKDTLRLNMTTEEYFGKALLTLQNYDM